MCNISHNPSVWLYHNMSEACACVRGILLSPSVCLYHNISEAYKYVCAWYFSGSNVCLDHNMSEACMFVRGISLGPMYVCIMIWVKPVCACVAYYSVQVYASWYGLSLCAIYCSVHVFVCNLWVKLVCYILLGPCVCNIWVKLCAIYSSVHVYVWIII